MVEQRHTSHRSERDTRRPGRGSIPSADFSQVRRLAPAKYCSCHFRGLAFANGHLAILNYLAEAGKIPLLAYFAAASVRAVDEIRMYPCRDCWYRELEEQLAKSRFDKPFPLRGSEYLSVTAALNVLYEDVLGELNAYPRTPVFAALLQREVCRIATGLPDFALDADGRLLSDDCDDSRRSAERFALHTGLLPLAFAPARQCFCDLLEVPDEVDAITLQPEVFALAAELNEFPLAEVQSSIRRQLSDVDLKELGEDVQAEFGRVVCLALHTPKPRKKTKSSTHHEWLSLHEQGRSYGQIAQLHHAKTGKKVTNSAIYRAIKRLRGK